MKMDAVCALRAEITERSYNSTDKPWKHAWIPALSRAVKVSLATHIVDFVPSANSL